MTRTPDGTRLALVGYTTMTKRRASAMWEGDHRSGSGSFRTESMDVNGRFTFSFFRGSDAGTSPEELLASAAACGFSLALVTELGHAGASTSRFEVNCTCANDQVGDGSRVVALKLLVCGKVDGLPAHELEWACERACELAVANCPILIALASSVRVEVKALLSGSA